jgi:hypothetical protein
MEFLLSMAGFAVILFLLGMLQYKLDNTVSGCADDAEITGDGADKGNENIPPSDVSPVAEAIHTYRRDRQTQESERAKRERITINVLITTAIFAFIAAIVGGYSARVFFGQLEEMHETSVDTKKAMIAANRAWISPISARIASSIDTAHDLVFVIQYRNTGREPANNFVGPPRGEEFGSIRAPRGRETLFDVFPVSDLSYICDSTVPDTQITVYQKVTIDYMPSIGERRLSDDMINGKRPFFVHGCFAYHSPVSGDKIIDKSEYCFLFLRPDLNPGPCPHGNNAN